MKSIITLVAAAILLAAPAVQNANAQLEITLGAGLNTPLGEYGDQTNPGYALTAGVGYRFIPFAAIGVETNYSGNKASDDALAGLGDGYEMSSSILQYSAMAKLLLPIGNHNVFAKGSVGNYRASATVSGPLGEGSITLTDLGYGLGGGFVIRGNHSTSLIADMTYHSVAFDNGSGDTNYLSITVGALISFDLFKPKLRDDLQDDLDKLRD
jgi:hypothetical protein